MSFIPISSRLDYDFHPKLTPRQRGFSPVDVSKLQGVISDLVACLMEGELEGCKILRVDDEHIYLIPHLFLCDHYMLRNVKIKAEKMRTGPLGPHAHTGNLRITYIKTYMVIVERRGDCFCMKDFFIEDTHSVN